MKKIIILIILFSSLLNIYADKSDIDKQIEKAQNYVKKNQYKEAINEFSKVYDLTDDIGILKNIYWYIGNCYYYMKDYENVAVNFVKIIELDKSNILVAENLGILYYKHLKDYKNAEKYLLISEKVNSRKFGIYFYLSCIYSVKNNKTKSIKYLHKSLLCFNNDSKNTNNSFKLIQINKDLDNIKNEKFYKQIFDKKELLINGINNLYTGFSYQNKKKYQEALSYYEKSRLNFLEIDDEFLWLGTCYNNIANLYIILNEKNKAVDYYLKSIELLEKNYSKNCLVFEIPYANIAAAYKAMRKYGKAFDYYNKSLELLKEIYGESHINIAETYSNIGNLLADAGKYDESLGYFEAAYSLYSKLNGEEHETTATCYNNIAAVYEDQKKYNKSLEYYMKSLDILIKIKGENDALTSNLYNNIGKLYNQMGEYEKALELYHKCRLNFERIYGRNHYNLGIVYNNIGSTLKDQGKYNEALEYHIRANKIFEIAYEKNHPTTAKGYSNIASIYREIGNYKESISYYNKSLEIFLILYGELHKYSASEYANLGEVYFYLGDFDSSLDYFYKSLAIRKKIFGNSHPTVSAIYYSLSIVYVDMGKIEDALKSINTALDIDIKVSGENSTPASTSYIQLALIYKVKGDYEKALYYSQKALQIKLNIYKETDIRMAVDYINIGTIYKSVGNSEKALEHYLKALDIQNKIFKDNKNIDICANYVNIGTVFSDRKNYSESINYYLKALEIAENILGEEHLKIAKIYYSLAVSSRGLGKYEKSKEYYLKAINIIEKIRDTAGIDKKTKAEYFATLIFIYYDFLICLEKLNDKKSAFYYYESIKSRALLDEISKDIIFNSKEIDSKYIQKLKELKNMINSYNEIISKKQVNNESFINEKISLNEIENNYKITLEEIYTLYPKFKEYSQGRILHYDEVQEGLSEKEVIIEYCFYKNNIAYIFIISKKDFEMIKIDRNLIKGYADYINTFRDILTKSYGNYFYYKDTDQILIEKRGLKEKSDKIDYDVVNRDEAFTIVNNKLYNLLIKPVLPYIKNTDNLIIIPDKETAFLPFETLKNENNKYLIEDYYISYAQSSALLMKSKKMTYSPKLPVLCFGGAVYKSNNANEITTELTDEEIVYYKNTFASLNSRGENLYDFYSSRGYNFKNLPASEDEVKAIGKLFYKKKKDKENNILTGFDVSEDRINQMNKIKALEKYQMIHFAAHGIVDYTMPEMSSLVLSQIKGADEDGFLTLVEILNLNLKSELVTLSACETGLGKLVGGEGITSLAQSFIMAGSKNVCMTLWSVSDDSTSEFMIEFYKKLKKGQSYKTALVDTKREFILSSKWKSPFFWAPFVLYGE